MQTSSLSLAKAQGSSHEDHIMTKQQYRVIIVDDEPDIMVSLRIVLESNGFKIQAFTDPILALTNFTAGSYDLALLDIRMPKITGLGLYKELIEIDNKTKVCFICYFKLSGICKILSHNKRKSGSCKAC